MESLTMRWGDDARNKAERTLSAALRASRGDALAGRETDGDHEYDRRCYGGISSNFCVSSGVTAQRFPVVLFQGRAYFRSLCAFTSFGG